MKLITKTRRVIPAGFYIFASPIIKIKGMANSSVQKILTYIAVFILVGLLAGGYYGYRMYNRMFSANVTVSDKGHAFVYIPTGSDYNDVISIINDGGYIINMESFKWMCSRMGYPQSVKPGRYKFEDHMGNREIVTILRAGLQTPVRVTFNGFRTPQQLAQRISKELEIDSAELVHAFVSEEMAVQYGFTNKTIIAMFVPNTYEFFWNTGVKGFFDRMKREYDRFWTDERDSKAHELNLDRVQVSTLASIVEEETVRVDERPVVAGVFVNRLKKRIPLQADPSIKFAHGDFTIRRILTRHLSIDSPYNTYKYRGLPPGPINAPSISSIDAVLNCEKHQYLYFCAKPDYSGYHVFSRTLAEHNRNAKVYQQFLNKEKIFR